MTICNRNVCVRRNREGKISARTDGMEKQKPRNQPKDNTNAGMTQQRHNYYVFPRTCERKRSNCFKLLGDAGTLAVSRAPHLPMPCWDSSSLPGKECNPSQRQPSNTLPRTVLGYFHPRCM